MQKSLDTIKAENPWQCPGTSANDPRTVDAKRDPKTCEWLKVQTAALKDDPASDEEIKLSVLEAQRLSVKFPIVRKVAKSVTVKNAEGKERSLKDDDIVICDIVRFLLSCIFQSAEQLLIDRVWVVSRLSSQRRF